LCRRPKSCSQSPIALASDTAFRRLAFRVKADNELASFLSPVTTIKGEESGRYFHPLLAVPCSFQQEGEARSRAIPHRSRRFGIGSSREYAACGWLGSTWQLRGWCQQPPGITPIPATQPLSKRPLSARRFHNREWRYFVHSHHIWSSGHKVSLSPML
jgi:hypothetical protein